MQLFIHNKYTNQDGVAVFCNDNSNIKVFKGNGDGSEDEVIDYETFLKNYSFYVTHETEQIPIIINI